MNTEVDFLILLREYSTDPSDQHSEYHHTPIGAEPVPDLSGYKEDDFLRNLWEHYPESNNYKGFKIMIDANGIDLMTQSDYINLNKWIGNRKGFNEIKRVGFNEEVDIEKLKIEFKWIEQNAPKQIGLIAHYALEYLKTGTGYN